MVGLVKCVVLLTAAVAASGFQLSENNVVFHLFTQANPTISQPLNPTWSSIALSDFSSTNPTIFTVHNYGESVGGNFNAFVVPNHLAAENVNIIAVDWSAGSGMYTQGLGNAAQAGRIIASFINVLYREFSYSPTNIRIVGHGLGGHIAGIAARQSDVEIPHIIALDPSFDGWTWNPDILKPSDAGVVEVIHATAGTIGYDYPLGDVDFYANGGAAQPGCGNDLSCSHIYAYAFYAESILRDSVGGERFIGTACDNYEQAIVLQCSGDNDIHFGGTEVKSGVSGIYTFSTNMVPPFARG